MNPQPLSRKKLLASPAPPAAGPGPEGQGLDLWGWALHKLANIEAKGGGINSADAAGPRCCT